MQRHGKETGGKAKKRTGGEPGRREWGGGEKRECGSAGLAEVFDPANEDPVIGGFDIEEFHADADTRLNNADDPEGFDGLFFVAKGDAHAGFRGQGLAGADETASHRDIGGDADRASAGFEVKKLGVRGEGVADGVAAVPDSQSSAGTLRSSIVHRDDVAPRGGDPPTTAHTALEELSHLFINPGNTPQEKKRA